MGNVHFTLPLVSKFYLHNSEHMIDEINDNIMKELANQKKQEKLQNNLKEKNIKKINKLATEFATYFYKNYKKNIIKEIVNQKINNPMIETIDIIIPNININFGKKSNIRNPYITISYNNIIFSIDYNVILEKTNYEENIFSIFNEIVSMNLNRDFKILNTTYNKQIEKITISLLSYLK